MRPRLPREHDSAFEVPVVAPITITCRDDDLHGETQTASSSATIRVNGAGSPLRSAVTSLSSRSEPAADRNGAPLAR